MRRALAAAAAAFGAAAAAHAYVHWIRPRQMTWGATGEEAGRELPGDDLVPQPSWNATRAVTVDASPGEIWPWLVQIGWGRAGWYGYDWMDNGFRPSVWRILPGHQDLAVGKEFPMSPWTSMKAVAFDPGHWMLWRANPADSRSGTWLWYLDARPDGTTRLITRMRERYRWTSPVIVTQVAVDLLDFFFMRKCLLGIKARAEALARGEIAGSA